MAFLPIGLTANLILNRLRNQQRVDDARRADEEDRASGEENRKAPSGELLGELTHSLPPLKD